MSEPKLHEPSLIPSLQADALAREIEQQLRDESDAMIAAAHLDARTTVAQARKAARARLHQSIAELRREGERRMARAKAEIESATRAQQQQQATRALAAAMPLLREALAARWHDADARKLWAGTVADLGTARLRRGAWTVEHPAGWDARERESFKATFGGGIAVTFTVDNELNAGLRIKADQAVLDATVQGLLNDSGAIAALLLDELDRGTKE